tara:strand:- start:144 stop:1013 length:870 start_codon:yes stop_codon:yes gene_type:complete
LPELPEVETVRKGLIKHLCNFNIDHVEVLRKSAVASPGGPQLFIEKMQGKKIHKVERRGKYLIASLEHTKKVTSNKNKLKGGWWGIHLRMTGHFQWHKKQSDPCIHTRVRFLDQNGFELRFVDVRSFGQMWWVPPSKLPQEIITGLQKLGPEPFSEDFNPTYLAAMLNKKTRTIKSALLDQSLVAGPGNIYADETLFASGISPFRRCCDINIVEIEDIYNNLVKILRISIGQGGTTFSDFRDLNGLNGNYGGQAFVYGRKNKKCRICNELIIREKISGRSSHWCPKCQK